jgi:DNA topoisomerase-1
MKISIFSQEECEQVAKSAALRYVQDSMPGITRKKKGKDFNYFYPDGTRVNEEKELKRISALGIPPAYQAVWICPFANGHIQATGRDSKNRKQYIYHELWQEARKQQKFDLMISFGQAIFSIRKHINKILSKEPSLDKEQIICAILYLLDSSCIRIGNTIYAEENKTYGLTTLRKKHLVLKNNQASLDFEGKNSKVWKINISNKKIVRLLKKCEEIPGYELFKYQDQNKTLNIINSEDINHYLKELTKHPFSAKDFRTWVASRELFCRLLDFTHEEPTATYFKNAIKEVASLMGHTVTICKKSYIHPEILYWWQTGKLEHWKNNNQKKIASLDNDHLLLFWLKKLTLLQPNSSSPLYKKKH